ncbi:MAG: hypothetical protein V1685_00450 [Parcubacteria group bacterium]
MDSAQKNPKSPQSNALHITLLRTAFIFGVIIFVGGAIYGLLQYGERTLPLEESYSITEKRTGEKIFTNKQFDYQVDLNPEWGLLEVTNPNTVIFTVPYREEDGTLTETEALRLTMGISVDNPEFSVSEKVDYALSIFGENSLESREQLTVSGYPAEKIIVRAIGRTHATYVKRENHFVVITGNILATASAKQYAQIYNDFLATVKL